MKWITRWQNVPPGPPTTLGSHWGGEDAVLRGYVSGCQGEEATGTPAVSSQHSLHQLVLLPSAKRAFTSAQAGPFQK